MVDRNLPEHPYVLVNNYINASFQSLRQWEECIYACDSSKTFNEIRPDMEEMHKELFQDIWQQYDVETYKQDRISGYLTRIDINNLTPFFKGKDCMNFGCGHGNFRHALVEKGARYYSE